MLIVRCLDMKWPAKCINSSDRSSDDAKRPIDQIKVDVKLLVSADIELVSMLANCDGPWIGFLAGAFFHLY